MANKIKKIIAFLFLINLTISLSYGREVITFISANPFGFKDIIDGLENEEKQKVNGILSLPKGEGPFPLIIGVAGSLNWSKHHLEYMHMYQEMGIATFELQSFSSRGVKSTVGSQIEVTTAMMILDAYKALEALSNNSQIDVKKAAITGWSLGGGVALYSGWKPLIENITKEHVFAAHLSIYPPCLVEPLLMEFTSSPMHILIGELDDWTPAKACEELVPKIMASGSNIDLTVYPNSHHSFDKEAQSKFNEDAYSTVDCRFTMKDDGTVLMDFLSLPMSSPLLQKLGLGLCADRGTTTEGNPESRIKAFEFAKEFMKKNLIEK